MSRDSKQIGQRDKDIKSYYLELTNKRYKGRVNSVPLYSEAAILEMVADKFYLSAKTIEKIVFNRVTYKYNHDEF